MRMKTRTIAGGLVVVGAILGSFMSGLLPGFGSGSGIGAEDAGNDSPSVSSDNAQQEPTPTNEPADSDVVTVAPAAVLDIRIDNHDYVVPDAASATGVRKVDLDEAVKLAQMTRGNDDGIRVRILRNQSARVTAWAALHDELVKAGLAMDSIRMPKDLIE